MPRHGFPAPRWTPADRERYGDLGIVDQPLTRCEHCAARFRVASQLPTGPACPICLRPVAARTRQGRLRQVAIARVPGATVYTDASFRAGVAGLAVTGALGEFTRRVSVSSSYVAERWALEMAMSIAHSLGRRDLTFCSDCMGVVRDVRAALPDGWGWTVEHVHRSDVKRAHKLAGEARRP